MLVAVQEFAFNQHWGTILVTSTKGELGVQFGDLPVSIRSSGKGPFVVAMMPGVEAPFGLFPGGFPVATFLGLSGKDLSPDLVAMLVPGVGILAGSLLSAQIEERWT